VKCRDAEFAICADPDRPSAAILVHVRACRACADLLHRAQAFNGRLRGAMKVPVPPAAPAEPWLSPHRRGLDTRWAVAACLVLVSILVGWWWIASERSVLAGELVAHVAHEPAALDGHAAPTADQLDALLRSAGLRLTDSVLTVMDAENCWIRGQRVQAEQRARHLELKDRPLDEADGPRP
jgi:hypothetical protein